MSDNNEQMVTTVNDHQHEEVDNADPESPTLAVTQSTSTTTDPVERPTDRVVTDNNADTADILLPGDTPKRRQQNPSQPKSRNEVDRFPPTLMQL